MDTKHLRPYLACLSILLAMMLLGGGWGLFPVRAQPPEPYLVKDINTTGNGANPSYMTNVGGTIFFAADDGLHGSELWRSDGTTTVLVKDIWPGWGGSNPANLTAVGDLLFFTAGDGSHGNELWRSDGSAAGTVQVRDIAPGTQSSSSPSDLTAVGGTIFFVATDGDHGYELWQSDGSEAGTTLVKEILPGAYGPGIEKMTACGGVLFFRAE